MMPMLKLVFLAGIVLFGGIGVFIGGIVMLTWWQVGAITLNYTQNGAPVVETITRTADAARFWRLFLALGTGPMVLGAAALWWGIRAFRR